MLPLSLVLWFCHLQALIKYSIETETEIKYKWRREKLYFTEILRWIVSKVMSFLVFCYVFSSFNFIYSRCRPPDRTKISLPVEKKDSVCANFRVLHALSLLCRHFFLIFYCFVGNKISMYQRETPAIKKRKGKGTRRANEIRNLFIIFLIVFALRSLKSNPILLAPLQSLMLSDR